MNLLKLIPIPANNLTAFTTFEAKASYPYGWTKKSICNNPEGSSGIGYTYNRQYKLQKMDTPASYGVK